MLSGETANGNFPDRAVSIMAAICANAEVGTNYYQVFDFIRNFTEKPMSTREAVLGCAAKNVLDVNAGLVVVVSNTGIPALLVAKYRPRVPILLVTSVPSVARAMAPVYGVVPYLVSSLPSSRSVVQFEVLMEKALLHSIESKLLSPGKEVIVVHGVVQPEADGIPMVTIKVAPGMAKPYLHHVTEKTLSLRTTAISLKDVMVYRVPPRKTKVICTLGPSCWSEEGLGKLLDMGMNIARFNFSHGTHTDHQQVLDRLRSVAMGKGVSIATLLDTKGPEVRTALVRGGKNIELVAGQEVVLVAVGDKYTEWEGYKDETTGETKIGISYAKLCQSVKPGNRILIADGTLSIEVLEILSDTELRGKALNPKSLGPRKNCNLPGVHVDIPVLTPKDVEDLQQFGAKNRMDFVAASFVQSAKDVQFIRSVLDEVPGGKKIKIISKIENEAGLINYDGILAESDGIMVARGDLAMEIPSWKVALAQKMLITKANIAGKFVITATQMLESMVSAPLPTRAEMTDVANAVFDGTDAVMLSGETANGKFPDRAVKTMAAIVANAENGNAYVSMQAFIRDHSSRPFSTLEAIGVTSVGALTDCNAQLIVTLTQSGAAARMVSKYRPSVPQVVVTADEVVGRQASAVFGQYAFVVGGGQTDLEVVEGGVESLVEAAIAFARKKGLWSGEGVGIVIHGAEGVSADFAPMMRVVDLGLEEGGGEGSSLLSRSSLPRSFSLEA
mmetsp:Transcript_24730/g.44560  ORF Transcript_24730/g.44560 Transcript_24730/m.44560 type:complete len:729 (-) Transcript_24730:1196-3382(-)